MPMPESPTYTPSRLSTMSWQRNEAVTGTLFASAKARKSAAASGVHVPPPTSASGRRASASSARICASCSAPGWPCADAAGGASPTVTTSVSMSSGSASATGPGRPGARGPERLLQELGQALGAVDLRDPLAELRQEAAVVDLLERLAIQHPAPDLADQHHERGRVLEGDVQPRRAVGRAGPARHQAHAGSPGELAVGLGHHRRGALLACRHEPDRVPRVVQGVEHGQVALAGHAEDELDALRAQAVDQHVATPSRTAHGQMPPMQRYLTSSHSSSPYFEPSRPMPDSLTPPNGDTSFEMKPVLMPTIPVSSPSETRQMRPMSRE